MEDSSLFMQWAMTTLHHEHQQAVAVDDDCGEATTFPSLQALREASQAAEMIQELIAVDAEDHPANSWSSSDGDATDGSSADNNNNLAPAAVHHDICPVSSPSNPVARRVVDPSRNVAGSGTSSPVTWNFSAAAAAAQTSGDYGDGMLTETAAATRGPRPDLAYGSLPVRRAGVKSSGFIAATYMQGHIIAERKRREKMNQRFIELSTVIPNLRKMDKATILSAATRYVKDLQEKLNELEAGGRGSHGRSVESETVVVVKRPYPHAATAAHDGDGSPLSASSGTPAAASKQLPEIEARFTNKSVMVRIHCENGKAVVVKVLAEIEELHLGIIHANVMPFSVEEGFPVTAEDIVSRLNSVLLPPVHSSCSSPELETGN